MLFTLVQMGMENAGPTQEIHDKRPFTIDKAAQRAYDANHDVGVNFNINFLALT